MAKEERKRKRGLRDQRRKEALSMAAGTGQEGDMKGPPPKGPPRFTPQYGFRQ